MKKEKMEQVTSRMTAAEDLLRQVAEIGCVQSVAYTLYAFSHGEVESSITIFLDDSSSERVRRQFLRDLLAYPDVVGPARRVGEELRLKFFCNDVSIHHYPAPFKVECETKKECFAVFPDGRKIPLHEVPQDLEEELS